MKKITTDIHNNIYLKEETIKLKKQKNYIEYPVIIIYKDEVITTWHGMGAALTESSSYNYSLLNGKQKKNFINDIYSKDGLNYNIGRLAIGSNDFSLSSYEYATNKDLSDFSILRDHKYIIPLLKDIENIKKLTLIASPWSPPSFMKNNKSLVKGGKLKTKYYDLYATYLRKYIESYKDLGFDINYLTIQNEPMANQEWESCNFSLEEQNKFIYKSLINELKDTNTSIILWDHNRENIYNVTKTLYEKHPKIKGIGIHWYVGRFYNNIKLVHDKYPDLFIYNTEMCCGYSKPDNLEWINDAEIYLKDIICCMNSGLNAYLEWNLLLDYEGGPSHIYNPVKSPVILNKEKTDYIKTPIYYYIKHISKYIDKDYQVVMSDKYHEDLFVVAAKKEKEVVVIVLNRTDEKIPYNLLIDKKYLNDEINAHSIITYVL